MLETDQYHREKAEHDFIEDQRYAMKEECARCHEEFYRDELMFFDDEGFCPDCMEYLELQADNEYERQKEEGCYD